MRVAVHIHSDWSYDGSWTLSALAKRFADRGYDALLMTEHDRNFSEERWCSYREACSTASEFGMLLIPGIEYSDNENVTHIPVWGDLPFLGEGRQTPDLLAEVAEKGGAAILAHPARREAWRRLDSRSLEHLVGVEVWNRKYDGLSPGSAALRLDEQLPNSIPFFGLDFHTDRQLYPLAVEVDVDRDGGSEAIIDALRSRRCRSLAFGLDGSRFMEGVGYAAARAAERSRRLLRPAVRIARRGSESKSGC